MLEGKFKCISGGCDDFMIEGNIYEFKDGVCIREDGDPSFKYSSMMDFHQTIRYIKIEPYSPTPKELLFNGAMCKTRSGNIVMYMDLKNTRFGAQNCNNNLGFFMGEEGYNESCYSEYLICLTHSPADILEIRKPYSVVDLNPKNWNLKGELIWERKISKKEKLQKQKLRLQNKIKKIDKKLVDIEIDEESYP